MYLKCHIKKEEKPRFFISQFLKVKTRATGKNKMRLTISMVLAAFLLIGIVAAENPSEADEKLVDEVADGIIDVVDDALSCEQSRCTKLGKTCRCVLGGCRC